LRYRLFSLAKEHKTTLFVILQATFKTFLVYKTGCYDLFIGTIVSGRDTPEFYDQIGSYARTELIGTLFSPDDSFSEAVGKVKRSNQDLAQYTAFTLNDRINELLMPEEGYEAFWKVNMLYSDKSAFHTSASEYKRLIEGLGMEIEPMTEACNTLIPIDMVLDCIVLNDSLMIDWQFDSSSYDEETIALIAEEYLAYVYQVTNDATLRFGKKEKLLFVGPE